MVEKDAERVSGGKAHFTLLDKIAGNDLMVQQESSPAVQANFDQCDGSSTCTSRGKNCGCDEFSLAFILLPSLYSQTWLRRGYLADLMDAGAIIRTAFCGPCFGAGDTPCNNGLSIRHTTRNFLTVKEASQKRTDGSRSINGCTFYCSNSGKWRKAYFCMGVRLLE